MVNDKPVLVIEWNHGRNTYRLVRKQWRATTFRLSVELKTRDEMEQEHWIGTSLVAIHEEKDRKHDAEGLIASLINEMAILLLKQFDEE